MPEEVKREPLRLLFFLQIPPALEARHFFKQPPNVATHFSLSLIHQYVSMKATRFLMRWLGLMMILPAVLSCEKEEWVGDPTAELRFSTDTVLFDTVFTTIGSATKRFTVKNPHDKKIRIASIALAGGDASDYRININGRSTKQVSDIELAAKDSLFVFVEVKVDPTNQNQPMVVMDSVVFQREGVTQDVKLVAWGQDVHLIRNQLLSTQTWTADKPYLVYESAMIDTGATLTLEPGTRVHFHRNSRFLVAGTLISEGTTDQPVIFQGDRLERDYADIPGQWDGIWIMPTSSQNRIDHSVIKNAIIGLQVDTIADVSTPKLILSNSRILHMTYAGILARGTHIKAYNSLIANCGSYAVALTLGGTYNFTHCTLANYWSGSTRNTPALVLNNYYNVSQGNIQIREMDQAHFTNCIIYGNRVPELGLDLKSQGFTGYHFNHCLIRTGTDMDVSGEAFEQIVQDKDPLFRSIEDHSYQLDSLSPAINQGDITAGTQYPLDILNNSRTSDEAPDLGAYEFIPGEGEEQD